MQETLKDIGNSLSLFSPYQFGPLQMTTFSLLMLLIRSWRRYLWVFGLMCALFKPGAPFPNQILVAFRTRHMLSILRYCYAEGILKISNIFRVLSEVQDIIRRVWLFAYELWGIYERRNNFRADQSRCLNLNGPTGVSHSLQYIKFS